MRADNAMRVNFAYEDLPRSDRLTRSLTAGHRIAEWLTRSKRSSTHFKAKVPNQDARRSFVALVDAIYGQGAKVTVELRYANSVTRISLGLMDSAVASFRLQSI